MATGTFSSDTQNTPAVAATGSAANAPGVKATSSAANTPAIIGGSTLGDGIHGVSQLPAKPALGLGQDQAPGIGVLGENDSNGGIGVQGSNASNGIGVNGFSKNGTGVSANSTNGAAALSAYNSNAGTAITAQGNGDFSAPTVVLSNRKDGDYTRVRLTPSVGGTQGWDIASSPSQFNVYSLQTN